MAPGIDAGVFCDGVTGWVALVSACEKRPNRLIATMITSAAATAVSDPSTHGTKRGLLADWSR